MPCGHVNITVRDAFTACSASVITDMREASASSLVLQSRAKPHASDCGMSDQFRLSRIPFFIYID